MDEPTTTATNIPTQELTDAAWRVDQNLAYARQALREVAWAKSLPMKLERMRHALTCIEDATAVLQRAMAR